MQEHFRNWRSDLNSISEGKLEEIRTDLKRFLHRNLRFHFRNKYTNFKGGKKKKKKKALWWCSVNTNHRRERNHVAEWSAIDGWVNHHSFVSLHCIVFLCKTKRIEEIIMVEWAAAAAAAALKFDTSKYTVAAPFIVSVLVQMLVLKPKPFPNLFNFYSKHMILGRLLLVQKSVFFLCVCVTPKFQIIGFWGLRS